MRGTSAAQTRLGATATGTVIRVASPTPTVCCASLGAASLSEWGGRGYRPAVQGHSRPAPGSRSSTCLRPALTPVCVCEFTGPLKLSQPTVSHHLKKLVAAGLLNREQRGTWAYYSLNRDAFAHLAAAADLQGAHR